MDFPQDPSPEEMETKHIARFKKLKPTKHDYTKPGIDVPIDAYESVASKNIFLLLAPKERLRSFSPPAVFGNSGLEISIVDCPPGNGPKLHIHAKTVESFMPLTGSYEIVWGKDGQHSVVLEPLDFIAVPAGVFRTFRNVSKQDAKMLVVVQGDPQQTMNDVYYQKNIGEQVTDEFGSEVWDKFKAIGLRVLPD